ncbi:MAG: DUF521 domain-containing protein [Deltaproteobacteria bacterium]|nr:DUF521 domain-containing protein [Deltaproteobacteria bacterium]
MELTREQQRMLEGRDGQGAQKAMEILLAYGECYHAKRMIPITSVHIAGNFPVLMDEGIEWLEDLARDGTRVYRSIPQKIRRCMILIRPMT